MQDPKWHSISEQVRQDRSELPDLAAETLSACPSGCRVLMPDHFHRISHIEAAINSRRPVIK
jgi:hypothetical protein